MIALGPLGFLAPWLLVGLIGLPIIWWVLRFVPPRPQTVVFPPTRLLLGLRSDDHTPKDSPWWLTALRLLLAALIVLALARPVLNPDRKSLSGQGPVVIVVDNGWASAAHWTKRTELVETLIARAERDDRPLMIMPTAKGVASPKRFMKPAQAREFAATLKPAPFDPNRRNAMRVLNDVVGNRTDMSMVWLSDGVDYGSSSAVIEVLKKLSRDGNQLMIVSPNDDAVALGLYSSTSEDGILSAHILRAEGGTRKGRIEALSARSEQLAEVEFSFGPGQLKTDSELELPLEIRNQIARLEIEGERSAGAVHLLDASSKWRRIGILSGEARETAQPLLSPLYYVERALQPFTEIVASQDRNLITALQSILSRDLSVVVLADIGRLVGSTLDELEDWVEQGGTLVRFAGPRLEQGGDSLLPQPIRRGGRTLGGSLSWSSPKPLADFDADSPFSGLVPTKDTLVRRQVLTDPSKNTDSEIWARLEDGTPLVSAARRGKGRIVLFHITANSEWSNLPMSGLFVEMLRRIVERSAPTGSAQTADGAGKANDASNWTKDGLLTPQLVLNGFGDLEPAGPNASPLKASVTSETLAGREHPPGYYGPTGAMRALNLLGSKSSLMPITNGAQADLTAYYGAHQELELDVWLLAAAFVLLLLDAGAVLALSSRVGAAALSTNAQKAALSFLLAASICLTAQSARAVDQAGQDAFALKAALQTRLAFVLTGDREIDQVSKAGLAGLSRVLAARTAVEPSAPMSVDVHRDELSFFPLLYWPLKSDVEALPDATLAKVDAYMKQGGIILFDTRDYHISPTGAQDQSPGAKALARLVGNLDIPPLAPVPEAHVLTKAFYLMRGFPGRWDGGTLWAEAQDDGSGRNSSRARRSDGVSSILITSNDFAAAWALDERNQPLYPAVPGGEMQREMAFRSGVNIVMYALTGNYKADQVHVPALLERLGH